MGIEESSIIPSPCDRRYIAPLPRGNCRLHSNRELIAVVAGQLVKWQPDVPTWAEQLAEAEGQIAAAERIGSK